MFLIIFFVCLFVDSISYPFQIGINEYSKTAKIYQNLGLTEPPKKPPGAFMRFCKEFMSKNPSSGKSAAEHAKTMGKQWKELNAAQKQPYEDDYKKDKVRK